MIIPDSLECPAAGAGDAGALPVQRLPIRFAPDERRVITLPFHSGGRERLRRLFDRIEQLGEDEVTRLLEEVCDSYCHRHTRMREIFREHFRSVTAMAGLRGGPWSDARKELLGSYVTMEYAIESTALFNPSIVPHPDQSGVAAGAVRFILSLRATGEGHISSISFRTGVIGGDHEIRLDPPASHIERGRIRPDKIYVKHLIIRRLSEMNGLLPSNEHVLARLPEEFTLGQLLRAVEQMRRQTLSLAGGHWAVETLVWLARSNYRIDLPQGADLTELVIFPTHEHESRGLEDLRLVCFVEDDGGVTYFGTYTAYNGVRVLPMMLQTSDFRSIETCSLNGRCAANKGMALFPRRIGGHYAMCSRIDGENLFLSYSDCVHFWESAEMLAAPMEPWELRQIGNCGSPIETPEGWLLLTHGVGPMRGYCIGAMLLDLEDPTKVRGHLRRPLLSPLASEREGYVPNVVYTCGAMVHAGKLYLPYAQADRSASMAVVELDELVHRLLDSPV